MKAGCGTSSRGAVAQRRGLPKGEGNTKRMLAVGHRVGVPQLSGAGSRKGERKHKMKAGCGTSSRCAVARRRGLPKRKDATKWEVRRVWHHDPTKALDLRLDQSVEAEF